MASKQVKPIILDNYLVMIKNSAGCNMYQHFYAKIKGEATDITKNGRLSCAFFVSSILTLFGLINKIHTTVDGTVKDLYDKGWKQIKKPKVGCILVWESQRFRNGESHKHIGFYLGKHKAISHSYQKRQPAIHHWTFGRNKGRPLRQIETMWWHKSLDK